MADKDEGKGGENTGGLTAAEVKQLRADLAEAQRGIAALKEKNEELLTEAKTAKKAKREAEERAQADIDEAARKSGNVEALEKSYQDKIAKLQADHQRERDTLMGNITTMTVDGVATRMASELAVQGSADILIPHIRQRLATEQRDGQFVTVVRDAKGQPSAASLDDLRNEITANPAFAPVLAGSKASGGGAGGSAKGGGAAGNPGLGGTKEQRIAAIQTRLDAANANR